MVLTVRQTIVIPKLPYLWWSMSLFTGRAVFPCRGAEADPRGLAVQQTMDSLRCTWTRWSMPPLCTSQVPSWRSQSRSHGCTR